MSHEKPQRTLHCLTDKIIIKALALVQDGSVENLKAFTVCLNWPAA